MTRRLGLLLVLLLWPLLSWSAITLEGTPTTSGGTGDFGDDSFAHTVAADANFLLFCGSMTVGGAAGGGEHITSVTYAGQALTLLLAQQQGANNRVELWYRLAPATGTNTVVVTLTPNDPWFINTVLSFKGVAQVAPTHTVSTTGSGTSTALTVSSAAGEMVVDCVGIQNGITGTVGTGQTERVDAQHDDAITQLLSTMDGAAGSVQPDWTLSEDVSVAHVAVSFAPLAVPGAAPGRLVIVP